MKPARTANCRSASYTTDREPFQGHNLKGVRYGDSYVVLSYDWWPLFIYSYGIWKENKDRYSVSTSKQRSQCRPNAEIKCQISTEDMQKLWKDLMYG